MTPLKSMAFAASSFALTLFAVAGTAAAQTSAPHAWRSADDQVQSAPAPQDSTFPTNEAGLQAQNDGQVQPPPNPNQQQPPFNGGPQQPPFNNGQQQPYYPGPNDNNFPPPPPVPARLTLPQGTFLTVRMSQWLSSDRNQQGDAFYATLAEPVVVDGIVVAQRGQQVSGRVTEAMKAGMAKGVSHLGLDLTGLTLVDGQQVSIQSQIANRRGPTSVGRDVGAVAGTTALGAIIGAAAGRGTGAAIGAGAGAAAGIIGVLLTRGQPTIVAPETPLTFRIQAPVTIATDRAPMAFRYVEPPDYQRGPSPQQRPSYAAAPGGYPYPAAPYYGYPSPYYGYGSGYGYGYGYGYGPGFGVYVGPGYGYFRGGGYRGGFYRR